MSTRTLLVVGTIIVVLLGSMLVRKIEDCAERGGKACPAPRFHSYNPER
jgi:hypothetical protein